uniref:Uncharacterized protein n=1 Tax=Tanacetum cinerariifolium TaxID=118510 RepID=A0A6L2KQH3_TANCI|nr:hypothetical protein [Tanacetum cinerariifolium]
MKQRTVLVRRSVKRRFLNNYHGGRLRMLPVLLIENPLVQVHPSLHAEAKNVAASTVPPQVLLIENPLVQVHPSLHAEAENVAASTVPPQS